MNKGSCDTSLRIFLNITGSETFLDSCHDDIVLKNRSCSTVTNGAEWNVTHQWVLQHKASQKYGVFPKQFLVKLRTSSNNSRWNAIDIQDVEVR